jgi:hypothetical protein
VSIADVNIGAVSVIDVTPVSRENWSPFKATTPALTPNIPLFALMAGNSVNDVEEQLEPSAMLADQTCVHIPVSVGRTVSVAFGDGST